ncbi:hypothetical protein E2562_024992 [Oryza meyeriana var. granulata]|uniref:Uncharacterized protein n=1 Tax=Oryza meyeriana var. granulata TaxID=110450 RepID=A0A6G1FC08_9ORYZ|nr:hypothetical protein E2562_024992 [Oryza meyeriana var. granulata]
MASSASPPRMADAWTRCGSNGSLGSVRVTRTHAAPRIGSGALPRRTGAPESTAGALRQFRLRGATARVGVVLAAAEFVFKRGLFGPACVATFSNGDCHPNH